jgi:hypothetical protein
VEGLTAGEDIISREQRFVVQGFLILDQLDGGRVGDGVVDVLKVFQCDIRTAEKINPFLCIFFILAGGGDDPAVQPDVGALFRNHILQIFVFLLADGGLAGIDDADGGFFSDHHIPYFISRILQYQRFLFRQKSGSLLKLCIIGGVQGITAGDQRRGENIPWIVHHDNIVRVCFIPQAVPAGDGFFHHGLVVKNAYRTPQIGDRVGCIRIKPFYSLRICRVDIGNVGDVFIVQLQQKVVVQHLLDHIFRRTDHIPVGGAVGDDGIHVFVGVIGLVVDLDAGLFFKHTDDIFIDIFSPVVNIHFSVFPCGRTPAAGENGCCQQAAAYR